MVEIKSHEMYEALLRRINVLMEAKPGSDEEFELKILAELVEKYESEHYPIEAKE